MNTLYIDLYSDMIRKIKCGSYQGHKVKAKPILLYSKDDRRWGNY